MPLHETDAFVLRTFTLKEADKVCIFFTREAGKVRGVARGARRLRSRYGASLEPFTEVALTYFQNENRELVSISDCEIIHSQFFEQMSGELLSVLHYFAELVIEFIPDNESNEKVYRLLAATMETLPRAESRELAAIARYFEIWILKLSGFFPDWRYCGLCEKELVGAASVWITNEGIPMCASCSGGLGDELKQVDWLLIREIMTQSPANFINGRRDQWSVNRIGKMAVRLINRVLERELKSYDLLDRLRPAELK